MKKETRGNVHGYVRVSLNEMSRKLEEANDPNRRRMPVKVFTAEERARLQASMKADAEARQASKHTK